ncbi:exodeoxyribonuclease III [bacterium]|nr:exodeoxyribonuclease III [bacterium]
MKLVSWNVNGLRAVMKKDFPDLLIKLDADIVCIQETKLQEHQRDDAMINIDKYKSHWSYSTIKKGYSGVAVYSRLEPLEVNYGIGIEKFDNEGRILELVFKDFRLYNVYFPNGQKDDERLKYKLDFYDAFFSYLSPFKEKGIPLVITGDYNTAHNEIDLRHPKANENRSGFLRIERDWLDRIVENGYVDTFRYLYPDTEKYSWWSYRFNARKSNAGWRIDYFFVTQNIIDQHRLQDAFIDNDVFGSDHCPVGLELEFQE